MQVLAPAIPRPTTALRSARQTAGIVLIALVAGATFGIWRGYDPGGYAAQTFLEAHQGAVRGLNALLPGLAAGALVVTLTLAFGARRNPRALWLYGLAMGLMIAGGVVTRLVNQPINAEVMGWTVDTMPADWADLRDRWWTWHLIRTGFSGAALLVMILAVFADRDSGGAG